MTASILLLVIGACEPQDDQIIHQGCVWGRVELRGTAGKKNEPIEGAEVSIKMIPDPKKPLKPAHTDEFGYYTIPVPEGAVSIIVVAIHPAYGTWHSGKIATPMHVTKAEPILMQRPEDLASLDENDKLVFEDGLWWKYKSFDSGYFIDRRDGKWFVRKPNWAEDRWKEFPETSVSSEAIAVCSPCVPSPCVPLHMVNLCDPCSPYVQRVRRVRMECCP